MKKPFAPLPSNQWNVRKARHLLNRAGFGRGSAPVSVTELAQMPPARAVDVFVEYDQFKRHVKEPDDLPGRLDFGAYRRKLKEKHPDDKEKRDKKYKAYRKKHRKTISRLKRWWLKRMHRTRRPLEEKLTLFWHGHFATEARVVKNAQWNYDLNEIFRSNATGNVAQLTYEVARSPAMLRYLDNDKNRARHPNENWARELLELHTMGLGHYTEEDVLESARAFTGWTIKDGKFHFKKSWHDRGTKHFLNQKGNFDGTDIIRILFQKKPVSGFIAMKLLKYFAERDPDPKLISELAKTLWNANFQLKPMLKTLFRSRYFYSEQVMESKIKPPVHYVVGLLNDLEVKPKDNGYKFLVNVLKKLGQDLFDPPNVSGWDGNRKWMNTSTMLHRYNLPKQVMEKNRFSPFSPESIFSSVPGEAGSQLLNNLTNHLLVRSLDNQQVNAIKDVLGVSDVDSFDPGNHSTDKLKEALLILLSSPEYQLC